MYPMTKGDRLELAMKRKGWNRVELGRRIGVSQQAVSQLIGGKFPSVRLTQLASDELGVPIEWLTVGDNPPAWSTGTSESTPLDTSRLRESETPYIAGGPDRLPIIGYVGAASDGHRGMLLDHPDWHAMRPGMALFRVTGNSAYPVLFDGQYAVISTTCPIHDNNLVVVETSDGWLVKRWCEQPDGKGVVLASPDSGRASIYCALADIGQRFKVVGVLFK